ncbi:hypothetical protein HBB16_19170 [Pseudonocardia sp. MCCB 268]|nr:hypothetical protein [Pseudonocardia cytotoxica]
MRRATDSTPTSCSLVEGDMLRKVPVLTSAIADVERASGWSWSCARLGRFGASAARRPVRRRHGWHPELGRCCLRRPRRRRWPATLWTRRRHLVLNVLDDVVNRLSVLTPGDDGWSRAPFTGALSPAASGGPAVDADTCDDVWLTVTDHHAVDAGDGDGRGAAEVLKSSPKFFDASGHVIELALRDQRRRHPRPVNFLVRAEGTDPTAPPHPALRLRRLRSR